VSDPRWSGEAKYRALLAVAEAANSRLDLSSALDAVAAAREGLVPIDAIGVRAPGSTTARPEATGPAFWMRSGVTPPRSERKADGLSAPG
jgi:hypothetical protein